MSKKKKISRIARVAMALLLAITTVFATIGANGGAIVKAADSEPAGRGTDWDYLYSEIRANGSGKAYPVGTRIYMDIKAGNNGDQENLYIDTLEMAMYFEYVTKVPHDENYEFNAEIPIELNNIIELKNEYEYNEKTVKSGGYWIFSLDHNYNGDEFYGAMASSEDEQYKNVKIPSSELNIAGGSTSGGSTGGGSTGGGSSSGGSGTTETKIDKLKVSVDWSKVPSLTAGTEIGDSEDNLPQIPTETVKTDSSEIDDCIECHWAIKLKPEFVTKGYIDQETYDLHSTFNYLAPIHSLNEKYTISDSDVYYAYALVRAKDGYKFGDSNGEDVSNIIESNSSNLFAVTDGNGKILAVFLRLGTPSEIENNKNGGSTGGGSTSGGSSSGGSGSGTAGNINSDAKADADSPVKGASLTNSKEEILNASGIFTEAEKEQIANGSDANVWLELKKVDMSTVSDTDKAAILDKAKNFMGEGTELTYFDASLFKQIAGQTAAKVSEPGIKMKLTIKIPTELLTTDKNVSRAYTIIRLHNGQAEEITGAFDEASGSFTFETDKFSTYAIAYKDTVKNNGGNGNGGNNGGNNGGSNGGSQNNDDDNDDSSDNNNNQTIVAGNTTNTPSTGASANTSSNNASASNGTAPKTGDSNAMMAWIVLAVVSLAGIVVFRKKRA